jgi:hypothetical protein
LRFILLVEVFYFRFNVILFRFCFWIFLSIALAARDGHFYGHATFTKKFLFIDFKLWTICRKKEKKSFVFIWGNLFESVFLLFEIFFFRNSTPECVCMLGSDYALSCERKKNSSGQKKTFFLQTKKKFENKKVWELLKRPNEFLSD